LKLMQFVILKARGKCGKNAENVCTQVFYNTENT
jgi:hypothetical protein